MGWLFAGLALAGLMMLFLYWWANTDVKSARKSLMWAVMFVAVLLGLMLLATGRGFFAILPIGYAVWRMAGDRRGGASGTSRDRTGPGPGRSKGTMTRSEAYDVLGLEDGAREEEINAAYRKLMAQVHPDKGGSSWMAAKLNEARRILLGK
ncbi:DnaJ domain-containing protein [Kordiimonas marina]|uniref:DnaJ domain-containing protein n=1 Tax=Kordiimonas marina TaxID=2872312 RepID=UPI001FF62E60|nr:DnaJ domain-containing protein [Kordiimonas marina]MCJ9429245.1 DnaJ domain-containing protein [Kordiimonas marina]